MLLGLGFRTKNTIWFQRSLHLLFSSSSLHYFHTNLKNMSSTSSSSSSSSSQCDEDFLPWLRAKSGVEISSVLSIGKSIYGRSLFASKFIQAGDSILKVPFSAHLTSDNILPEINSLLSNDVGDVSRLAIVILIEQIKGQASEWAPYISSLPQAGELHSTIFWSKEELEMIRQSSVYEETISQKAQLEKEYFTLRPALDQFPKFFKDTTFEDFVHAFVLVASRAWESSKAVSLVPFADFLNHDGNSEAVLLIDEDEQISEVIADQDYTLGQQVLVSYGKYPNSTLLLDFGFTLSYNNYDQVQIQMISPQHDPLRNLKLELVHKHSAPLVTDSSSIDSFQNSFIIKEVKSSGGKGKGIPQSLRAFARILCTDTFEELKNLELEAVQTDGRLARRPLKNVSREIQSHQLLLSRITQLIQDYDASVKSLKRTSSHCIGKNVALRKQMAHDLLSGELRILRSASVWLDNYCSTLSKETTASHYILSSLDCLEAIE